MVGFLILLTLASVILLIVLYTRMVSLENKVRSLEWELHNVQRRVAQIGQETEPRPVQPPPVATPAAQASPPLAAPPVVPSTPYPVIPQQVRQPLTPPVPS